jgi:hypothetical protein
MNFALLFHFMQVICAGVLRFQLEQIGIKINAHRHHHLWE